MSVLTAADKRPVTTLAVFFTALVALILLTGWKVWAGFGAAALIGTALTVMYVIDVSAPYRTRDCHTDQHVACAECWCECHIPEEVAA